MAAVAARSAARLFLVALLALPANFVSGQVEAGDDAVLSPNSLQTRIQIATLDPRPTVGDRIAPLHVVPEPFGLATQATSGGGIGAKWRGAESEIRADLHIIALCRSEPESCPSPAARKFIAIVDIARQREGRARIGEINRAVNLSIRPMSDMDQHGVPDLWSAPLATLTSGLGDCEDYAIVKFAALREAGIADADLRLLVVHEPGADSEHAVLSVRLEGIWLILDNRRLTMMEDKYFNARPLFALQFDSVRAFTARPADPIPMADVASNGTGYGGWSATPLLM